MTAEWYYAKNKQKVGPVTEVQLKEAWPTPGKPSPTDMVWKQGTAQWMQASQVEGLIEAGPSEIVRGSVSPPLPPLPPPVPVAEWYFVNNGQQLGPVTVEQLRAWITPSDRSLARPGMPAWAAASSLEDLSPFPVTLAATPTDFDGDGPCGRCGKVFKMKVDQRGAPPSFTPHELARCPPGMCRVHGRHLGAAPATGQRTAATSGSLTGCIRRLRQ